MHQRCLIVNADDYGLTASVSAGIRQAHLRGLVTSSTVMMNQPGAAAELERALAECPRLGLGVHLVLTKGKALLPPGAVGSLVQLGDGTSLPSLAQFHAGLGQLEADEVQAEWRAQVTAFVRVTGRPPTHIDSHHHTAYLSAPLFGTLLALAREFGCPVRSPLTSYDAAQRHLGLSPEEFPTTKAYMRTMLAESRVPRPDHFEARFYGPGATASRLRQVLAELPPGTTELMCHPALPDAGLPSVSSYHSLRAQELAALTAPGLRAAAEAAGVWLIHFGALAV